MNLPRGGEFLKQRRLLMILEGVFLCKWGISGEFSDKQKANQLFIN